MKYPEGETVKPGDLVWTNEGASISRVICILDSEKSIKEMGLDESGILCNYDLTGNLQHIAGFEAEQDFEKEGIGLLSSDEKLLIRSLAKLFSLQTGFNIFNADPFYYGITRYGIISGDGTMKQNWFLMKYDQESWDVDTYQFDEESLIFTKITVNEYNRMTGGI